MKYFTPEQVAQVHHRLAGKEPVPQIARDFQVPQHIINQMKWGLTYDYLDREEWISLVELAEQYSIDIDRVASILEQGGYDIVVYRKRRYARVSCKKHLLDPFFEKHWIPLGQVARTYGCMIYMLKRLADTGHLTSLHFGETYYLEQEEVARYFGQRDGMIPLGRAAPLVGLSRQRLHELKDKGCITVCKVAGRYYVSLPQLRAELLSRGLAQELLRCDGNVS